ncbi:hypothetical protein BDN71DRAFT_1395899, partial [Pleurotus eryngii]
IKVRYMFKDLILESTTKSIETGAPALRAADALVTLTDFFAQIVWTYRCWSIWHHNYMIIILPVLLSLASVSCAMATIGLLNATPNAAIVPPALVPLGTAAFALPLVFNFLITGLITGRIWWQSRQRKASIRNAGSAVGQPNSSYAKKAMIVVVEAGVLYLLVQFVLTVLFAINHPAQIILADIAMQVYGIAPTLIFVHVNLRRSLDVSAASDVTHVDVAGSLPRSPRRLDGITVTQSTHIEKIYPTTPGSYQEFVLSRMEESPPNTARSVDERR